MKKDNDNILKFEEDDTSQIGINGKQVFFTKRINGKTSHNKTQSSGIKMQDLKKEENRDIVTEYSEKEPEIKKTKKKINKRKQSKKSKKRKRKTLFIKIVLILMLFTGVTIFALISPIFNIEKIEIDGNEKVNEKEIISLSGIGHQNNIFRISLKDIEQKIKENAYIDTVNIARKLPGTLKISVKERSVKYQVQVINSYVYIDYQGYILEVSENNGNVPLIEGFVTDQNILLNGKRLIKDDLEKLRTLINIIDSAKKSEVLEKIYKIKIENEEYVLELKGSNRTVYLGNGSDSTNKMNYLKMILEDIKDASGKIFLNGDLNSGFKAYFKEDILKEET